MTGWGVPTIHQGIGPIRQPDPQEISAFEERNKGFVSV
jgi:predicted component of type VI protein secretion system